ncbi:cyclophilin-like fold protein [Haloferax sulfurifontis]|uniref:Cyclophilin-like domain-containing protein n=1 Tax=Haloferax sulfurifontis ATCC BAA-897 TaxID=662480 RepID=M0IB23_9EURY|nr:hypothetical protein C441_10533 [Haloferax sulfurifontis ATCC BAA-897]
MSGCTARPHRHSGSDDGVDPEVGDITYYAPWGNLAIFYREFGYASGLVKLGHIEVREPNDSKTWTERPPSASNSRMGHRPDAGLSDRTRRRGPADPNAVASARTSAVRAVAVRIPVGASRADRP